MKMKPLVVAASLLGGTMLGLCTVAAARDLCERRWDRKAGAKYAAEDALIETGLRELGRAITEPRVDWHDNPQQTSREWALIQGAIYGADFQRWEREWAS